MRREIRNTGIRVALIEPSFAKTAILNVLDEKDYHKGAYKAHIEKAIERVGKVTLLAPEDIASKICDNLFTSPCRTRTRIAFWNDQILIFLLYSVLPDSVADYLLCLMFKNVE